MSELVEKYKTREEWRPVPDFEGVYEVSSEGRVRRLILSTKSGDFPQNPHYLKHKDSIGYPVVRLTHRQKSKSFLVHKLVMLAFRGPVPDGHQIAHNDGNKKNPRLINLRFATPAENYADRKLHGTEQTGKRNPLLRLKPEDVRKIRARLVEGGTVAKVAAEFGLGESCIANIKHRRTHKYV